MFNLLNPLFHKVSGGSQVECTELHVLGNNSHNYKSHNYKSHNLIDVKSISVLARYHWT